MKLFSCILTFLLIIKFAKSQILNLRMSDRILDQSNARLMTSASRLATAMFSFAETVRNSSMPSLSSAKKVQSTNSRVQLTLAELANILDYLKTFSSSQETFPNLSSSCEDIHTKIIRIETNVRKYEALSNQAFANMTLIEACIKALRTFASAEKSTLNLSGVLKQANMSLTNFQSYMKQLKDSTKAEITVQKNFENYRRGKCLCLTENSLQTLNPLAIMVRTISEMDTTLRADQTNIKRATFTAFPKVSAAVSANINDLINFNLQQLLFHFRRVSTCFDFPVDSITVTSCPTLLSLVGKAQFRSWLLMEKGIAERNLTLTVNYLSK